MSHPVTLLVLRHQDLRVMPIKDTAPLLFNVQLYLAFGQRSSVSLLGMRLVGSVAADCRRQRKKAYFDGCRSERRHIRLHDARDPSCLGVLICHVFRQLLNGDLLFLRYETG